MACAHRTRPRHAMNTNIFVVKSPVALRTWCLTPADDTAWLRKYIGPVKQSQILDAPLIPWDYATKFFYGGPI